VKDTQPVDLFLKQKEGKEWVGKTGEVDRFERGSE